MHTITLHISEDVLRAIEAFQEAFAFVEGCVADAHLSDKLVFAIAEAIRANRTEITVDIPRKDAAPET